MPPKAVRFLATTALMLILVVAAQAVLGLPYRPRFASPTANYWAVAALSTLTPVLAYFLALTVPRKWLRRTGYVCATALLLPCLFISSCAMLEAPRPSGPDTSYELLSEARAGRFAYRLYRTDCGATCAYGLDLREELDLSFGAKLVSPIWSLYGASEGAVKLENSSVVVVNRGGMLGRVAR
jgi:hypothetical protein